MRTFSLRHLVTAILLSAISIALILISAFNYSASKEQIEEVFDAQLIQSTKLLAMFYQSHVQNESENQHPLTLVITDSSIETFEESPQANALEYEHKYAYQIFDYSGNLLARTDNAPTLPLSSLHEGYVQATLNGDIWHTYRHFSKVDNIWIISAQHQDIRYELIHNVQAHNIWINLLIIAMVVLFTSVLHIKLFKPIKQLAASLEHRLPGDLTPLTLTLPNELTLVQDSINRITRLLEQERNFSSMAAHELKTPLAVIKLHYQNLLDEVDNSTDEYHKEFSIIASGIDAMSQTIEQLLLLSRIESTTEFETKDVEFQELFNMVINQLLPLASQRQWQVDCVVGTKIYCEINFMTILIRNLLENACKYSPNDSLINITVYQSNQNIHVDIDNEGVNNITSEQCRQLTQRFYRINQNDIMGTGLGLAICQRIIELHQGELVIIPNKRRGLLVSMILPL